MKNQKAFTLLEVMILVAIIGLLAAIAIPNFVLARQMSLWNECVKNLEKIEAVKIVWKASNPGYPDYQLTKEQVYSDHQGHVKELKCPCGGDYTISKLNEPATCSYSYRNGRIVHVKSN